MNNALNTRAASPELVSNGLVAVPASRTAGRVACGAARHTAEHAVLFALWDLARRDVHATVLRVCEASGHGRPVVEATLKTLERAGLVDASRVRLSLAGLTLAVSIGTPRRRRNVRTGGIVTMPARSAKAA